MSNIQNISTKKLQISKQDFKDKNVYSYLENMKVKTFSPIIQSEDKFISYFIESKKKPKNLEYINIKDRVKQLYSTNNSEKIIKQYLDLIKSSLHIQYVR
jgi:hypothetical protein